ncbi:hypothetical protein KUTeg_000374 [Tegillarca granosa]|uniref:1-alkyl-2-acetylglycerophosphocholine esterase n=1 Tax=Tegillarca granosa TaxID=220873 RepID=A0ABQ9FXE3_TEGGR|nr:hypothetical protein KUTeg_000374 [Tegillarca granosa]
MFKKETDNGLCGYQENSMGMAMHIFLEEIPKYLGKCSTGLEVGDVYIPALWQCPLCPSNKKFPVVIFSHGLGGNRTSNSTMCCELASQGFIVASVEHRLPSSTFTQVHHRADECIRVLNVLSSLNDGDEVHNILGGNFDKNMKKQFRDRIDMLRVSVAGHSFGGATAVCTLSKDKRFRVGIILDAWMHPLDEDVYKNTTQPLLMLNMETFQWKANILQMKKLESDLIDRVMITLKGGCHQSVTDFQFIIQSRTIGKLLDIRHDLSPKIAIDVCNKATLGFMRKHLDIADKDTHEDILSGENQHVISGTNVDLT